MKYIFPIVLLFACDTAAVQVPEAVVPDEVFMPDCLCVCELGSHACGVSEGSPFVCTTEEPMPQECIDMFATHCEEGQSPKHRPFGTELVYGCAR